MLVAETDGRQRSLLCWLLAEDPRFQVVAQVDNAADLAAITTEFDLALVDLNLAGSIGLAPLRSLSRRRPKPVVAVLADTGPVYLRHAAAAEGASGWLVRSTAFEHLADDLYEMSRRRG
jgi:DNA-binding NarL/FixJ family response regulator